MLCKAKFALDTGPVNSHSVELVHETCMSAGEAIIPGINSFSPFCGSGTRTSSVGSCDEALLFVLPSEPQVQWQESLMEPEAEAGTV